MNPVHVTVYYDTNLQKITGVEKEPAVVSSNTTFLYFLHFIFTSYPQIPQTFPEGALGMLLNNNPPTEYDVLQEGDVIQFTSVIGKGDISLVN
jgi:hypothetical protein